MAQMTPEQADAFLRETRIGKLATLNADGSPTIAPIWYEWDGNHARIFTGRDTPKVRRLRHDPRAALSVETLVGEKEAWVTIEGTVEIIDQGGYELAARLAPRYYDTAKAERTLVRWKRDADQWVVLEITPTRIRSSAPE